MLSDTSSLSTAYPPSSRSRNRWVIVVLSGLLTTAFALVSATWLEHYTRGGFYILGMYAAFFPAGAIFLGFVAASGYAAAILATGLRVSARLLCGIALLTFAAYFSMLWLDFKVRGPFIETATNSPIGFIRYFDLTTRSFQFHSVMNSGPKFQNPFEPAPPEETLGSLGYGVRLLEVGGFMFGTLCSPFLLRKRRYCEQCQSYYLMLRVGVIPASVPLKKTLGVFTPNKVRLDGEHAVAAQRAGEMVNRLSRSIAAGEVASFRKDLDELQPGSKIARKLVRRVEIRLSRCPYCGQAVYHPTLLTGIDPRKTQKQVLTEIRLPPNIAGAVLPGREVLNGV